MVRDGEWEMGFIRLVCIRQESFCVELSPRITNPAREFLTQGIYILDNTLDILVIKPD